VPGTLACALADLTLPDPDGTFLRLGELWTSTPAILVFLRHYGCIFCREHVAQLRDHEAAFEAAGARVAAIGLGDRAYARAFREETGIRFPLLVDEERKAYRIARLRSASLLHLFSRANAAARTRARSAGHRQHRLGKHPFQLGGSFVLGPGDVVRYAHVSGTFGENASPEHLLAALEG
jgi:peroxiredoxin